MEGPRWRLLGGVLVIEDEDYPPEDDDVFPEVSKHLCQECGEPLGRARSCCIGRLLSYLLTAGSGTARAGTGGWSPYDPNQLRSGPADDHHHGSGDQHGRALQRADGETGYRDERHRKQ